MLLSCHSWAHIDDAPYHFLEYGKKISEFNLSSFMLTSIVIESFENNEVSPLDIPDKLPNDIEAILFKTNNSKNDVFARKTFTSDYVSVYVEAAEKCASIGIKLVGIDYLSVDKYETTQYPPVHYYLMNNNIMILETISLKDIPTGRYKLICFPIKIKNAEASQIRAVLISQN